MSIKSLQGRRAKAYASDASAVRHQLFSLEFRHRPIALHVHCVKKKTHTLVLLYNSEKSYQFEFQKIRQNS